MPNYRTTELPEGIKVGKIMSFFTTRFDCGALAKNRRETYPFWAMIYTHSGNITFRIGEETYSVGAGELIFYPAALPHSIIEAKERTWEVSFITFESQSPEMNALAGKVFLPDAEMAERIRGFFRFGERFFYNLPSKDSSTVGMYCKADALEKMKIRLELEDVLTRLYLLSHERRAERKNAVFSLTTEYMQEHLGEPLSLQRLAAVAGVSISTLKKTFQRESGGGVNSYYIELKLSHAAKLLCESEMSVGEIAERLGYTSQFYFSEQFKARYGVPPMSYRKQQERSIRELL